MQVAVERLERDDVRLADVARFIADLNRLPEHHIGYLSLEQAGVLHELREMVQGSSELLVATVNGEMVGVLGFDADPEIGRTWLYGPFVAEGEWQRMADELWNVLDPLIQEPVREVEVYCNAANTNVIAFARGLRLAPYKDAVILRIDRDEALAQPEPDGVMLVTPEHHQAFVDLHQATFPNTYYTGVQILDRVAASPDRRVFAIVEGGELLGYAHVEALPDLADATIEFVGVSPAARGKGVGTRLLHAALHWIFSYPTINVLSLTTETDNAVALRLYQRAGFRIIHEMRSFRSRI